MTARTVRARAAAAVPPPPPPSLQDLLWQRWMSFLGVKRRLYVMRSFVKELDHVTRGKPFTIRNDVVWNMVLDARDKLVIDLYSVTVEMRHGIRPQDPRAFVGRSFMGKRGMFLVVRDHHTASFSRTYVPHHDDDEHEVEMSTRRTAELFARLFPDATGDSPTANDIEDLCERFRRQMLPLGLDRNKNRAHAHEGELGQARMLSVDDLEALFAYAEDLLESLSLASAGPSLGGGNMNNADCEETAADLVDQILFGNLSDIRRLTQRRTRDQLYARLHQIDEQQPHFENRREMHFNDRQYSPPFEDFAVMLWQDNSATT